MHPDQLKELKLSELRKRAAAFGVDPDELEAARDEDQPKAAIIALLVKREAELEAEKQAAEQAAAEAAGEVAGQGGDKDSNASSSDSDDTYDDDPDAAPAPEDSMASTADMSVPAALKAINDAVQTAVKRLYTERIRPLEQLFQFDQLHDLMTEAEFDSKPSVLLIGQYSVGKTTFIRNLVGCEFPGQMIGPEPTTDRFMAVVHGKESKTIPGNSAVVSAEFPYRSLSRFGIDFLNKFEVSMSPSSFLQDVTLIDTPGILSGRKQTHGRQYNFQEIVNWFADRADMIMLLFDANKLDIGDEFNACIKSLRGHENKVRVVLNKADACDKQQLMRVYGSLMWSLGNVLRTPEVCRVYIGSFRDGVYNPMGRDNTDLFNKERNDLMRDLRNLPHNSVIRKINDLVKRVRILKVHICVIHHLRDSMPSFMGVQAKQKELVDDLENVFSAVETARSLAHGDFPDVDEYRRWLQQPAMDFTALQTLQPNMLERLDTVLAVELPKLLAMLPETKGGATDEHPVVSIGPGEGWEECEGSRAESCRWQLDDSALECPLCTKSFGMTRRRHHCRKCGGVFCDSCTIVPKGPDSRICLGCKATSFM